MPKKDKLHKSLSNELKDQRIVIIHSGSKEAIDDIDTLNQVEEIAQICCELELKVEIEDVNEENIIHKLANYDQKKTIIFNLVEKFNGSDANIYQFTSLLDFFNLKYSGANTEFLLLTKDKILTKKILKLNNISTPNYLEESEVDNRKLPKKFIIKSASEHCSFGIDENSVNDKNLAKIIADKKKEYKGNWFAEEYIDGKEFNVSIIKIDGKWQVLPIPEMFFKKNFDEEFKILHYKAKWDEDSESYYKSSRKFNELPEELVAKIKDIAMKTCDIFKANSYLRIDFRLSDDQNPLVIDINANPCLSQYAGFMATSKEFNLDPKQVISIILENSL